MEYRRHFYITLFSNANHTFHLNNTLAEFTVQLARRIDLGSIDDWKVGLCQFACPSALKGGGSVGGRNDAVADTNAMIYCNLIAPQLVGSDNVRCLRAFVHPSKMYEYLFKNVFYLPVERRTFQDVSISIRDLGGAPIPFKSGALPTKLVLHFRRI